MARIYKRKDIWYLDFQYKGRRIRRKIGKLKSMAEFALKDVEVKIVKDELGILRKEINIDKFIDGYLSYIKVNKREKTAIRYREIIEHFKKFIRESEAVRLSEITPLLIEKYKQERLKLIKPITVNYELDLLKAFFKRAIKDNYIKENPLDDIERLKVTSKQPRFFAEEELREILIHCEKRDYPVFLALTSTGMRLGELINLEWEDVDLERRAITIRVKDFWEPKNSKPRAIPMTNKLVEVLKELQRGSRWVFAAKKGTQLNRNHLRERLVKLCMNIGIEPGNIHTFRHTFASHLIMKGVDLPTVQKLMGHSDIKTTMIYAHLAQEHLQGAIEKLEF
jgi:site-specific recombinase XerD